jgi:hypothetical protein
MTTLRPFSKLKVALSADSIPILLSPVLFCTVPCLLVEASGGRSLSRVEKRCYRRHGCISEEESFKL